VNYYIGLFIFFVIGIVLVAFLSRRSGNKHRDYVKHLGPEDKLRFASKAFSQGAPVWFVRRKVGLDE